MTTPYRELNFPDGNPSHMYRHFTPYILELARPLTAQMRVLDVGCGNGNLCAEFRKQVEHVVGIDLSESGIAQARVAFSNVRFELLAADDQVLVNLKENPFDLVVSTEVVEHLYDPRAFVRGCYAALKPGGRFICSTPYHGYLKNLCISLAGKWDQHASPLWDCGHIKLWSRKTLSALLMEAGFCNLKFKGAGRLPYLWMTMVMAGDKPSGKVMEGSLG